MTRKTELSEKLFQSAQQHIPGGVNSPVRAFKSVGGTPPFITRAKGAHIFDADGNEYIDYVLSWGPAILGHAEPRLLNVLNETMKAGLSFGAPTAIEIKFAEAVKAAVPSLERVRCVNSGTEATMSAIRVARGFTGRDKIIKFDGCYHGHADYLLVKAGSGAATLGIPDSAGVPASFAEHTLVAKFNDSASVATLLQEHKVACVIVEPVMGNIGCIAPQPGFLQTLRELCDEHGTLLIFDEVMTGFRVARGGAQELYNIKPDLSCFGKILGGGLPAAAYGGRADVMNSVAPTGNVYQAGTLSGNPLAMAVGVKTLELLSVKGFYESLEEKGAFLENGLRQAAKEAGVVLQVNRVGSMFSFFFTDHPVTDADSARAVGSEKFKKVFHHMLDHGIYLAPSAFEAGFLSAAHSFEDLEETVRVFTEALKS